MDTVNIGGGLLFDFSSEGFVTHGAVDQRLHQRTQTTRQRQVRAGSSSHSTFLSSEKSEPSYSVVPKLARRSVSCPLLTLGGFKVEVVVEESHIKDRLRRKRGRNGCQLSKLGDKSRTLKHNEEPLEEFSRRFW